MSSIRKRKRVKGTVYLVDFKDALGVRRRLTASTNEAAELLRAEKVREAQQTAPPVSPELRNITLAAYAKERWLKAITMSVTPETVTHYGGLLERYVLPTLGRFRVREIHRGMVKAVLVRHRETGLGKHTVRLIRAALSSLLREAGDDGIILTNPAAGVGWSKRKGPDTLTLDERRERVRPFSREHLSRLLAMAEAESAFRRYAVLLRLMARSGLRPGEARALRWEDLDFAASTIRVERSLTVGGRLKGTKTGQRRTVDMTPQLAAALRRLQAARREEALRRGWGEVPEWVFVSEEGTPMDHRGLGRAFKRVLKKAGLPLSHRVYDLRHTFATLLLAEGVPITYVASQLGHAKPTTTLNWYARWLPNPNRRLVDALDDTPWHRFGTKAAEAGEASPQVRERFDEPLRSRPADLVKANQEREGASPKSSAALATSCAT